MADVLGWRKVFAVIGPSTNTIVQPDMEAMRPNGVTNQYRDIYVENPAALSDAAFMAGVAKIGESVKDCLRTAMTFGPDYLVLGVSAISFIGGLAGGEAFSQRGAGFHRPRHQLRVVRDRRRTSRLRPARAARGLRFPLLSGGQRSRPAIPHGVRLRGGA